nr:hypothetical protein [Actinomadura harenae]
MIRLGEEPYGRPEASGPPRLEVAACFSDRRIEMRNLRVQVDDRIHHVDHRDRAVEDHIRARGRERSDPHNVVFVCFELRPHEADKVIIHGDHLPGDRTDRTDRMPGDHDVLPVEQYEGIGTKWTCC